MKVEKRLLKYIAIKTPCDENSDTVPTSQCQFDLARILADELKELGLDKVVLDDKCFVYGILAATPGYENKKKLGLIAHMDTVPEFCEAEIHPVCTPDYDGCDLVLGDSGRVLTTKDFPHLKGLKGRTLITSDGNTILGVDDKAGIAEIMQLLEILITEKIPHGQISVAFTPDEECGSGAAHFDFDTFDAEVAYTLDGDGEGEIQYQNFNACEAKFEINGKNVHPGSAKDVMINAVLIAADINNMLPRFEIPRHTEQYEGFYHLLSIHGDEGHPGILLRCDQWNESDRIHHLDDACIYRTRILYFLFLRACSSVHPDHGSACRHRRCFKISNRICLCIRSWSDFFHHTNRSDPCIPCDGGCYL